MRNIVTLLSLVYLCCLQVIVTRHEPSHILATHYRSGVLDMYEKAVTVANFLLY